MVSFILELVLFANQPGQQLSNNAVKQRVCMLHIIIITLTRSVSFPGPDLLILQNYKWASSLLSKPTSLLQKISQQDSPKRMKPCQVSLSGQSFNPTQKSDLIHTNASKHIHVTPQGLQFAPSTSCHENITLED